jgi:PAS domain S-box-containing protein
MTGFFQKISFRIWLPFALTLSLMMLVVAFYYPREQEKLFRANKERELKELAKTVALGVELSLRADDFQGLKKTIDFVSGTSDFEFVAIIVEDSITAKENVFISYPEKPQDEILTLNPDLYVYQKYPFRTADFVGNILISASKEKINELVFNLNKPVYIILPIILAVSLLLFFILARRISRPILQLTKTAKELEAENYAVVIPVTKQKDELGELSNAFASLRDSLVDQKDRNMQLTLGLEDEIKLRTADLQSTQQKLIEAQKVARIGHYEFFFSGGHWESSDVLDEIFGIDKNFTKDLKSWNGIVAPDYQEEMMSYFIDLVANKKKFSRDYKIQRVKDGELRWVYGLGEFKYSESGLPYSLSGTIQDITDRKLIEEEVKKLSLVARHTSNCVIIADGQKKIQWVNDSLIQLSGYSFDEIVGRTPRMFQFEKTDLKTLAYISERLGNGLSVNTEILNRGKKGNEYWLELNIVPITDAHGALSGYIAVETDITARKAADEELLKSQEALKKINETLEQKVLENTKKNLDLSKSIVEQEKLATIGEISAGIAHDLNTPLGAIKVGTESVHFTFETLLANNISKCSDAQLKRAMEIAKSRTVEIYVGGLQLMRERKETIAYLQATYGSDRENLGQIAEMMVKCRILVQDTEIMDEVYKWDNPLEVLELINNIQIIGNLLDTIKTSVDKASKVVKDVRSFIKTETTVDRTRVNLHDNISTVLSIFNYELKRNINLVFAVDQNICIEGYDIKLFQLWSNLIKNAIESMEDYPNKNISVRSVLHDGKVDILVENTGPVIGPEIIEKIFKKFFTTKQGKNGTGLGLSIVMNVVDEHGAKIAVTSSEEVTTFKVTFNDPILLS